MLASCTRQCTCGAAPPQQVLAIHGLLIMSVTRAGLSERGTQDAEHRVLRAPQARAPVRPNTKKHPDGRREQRQGSCLWPGGLTTPPPGLLPAACGTPGPSAPEIT